MHAKLRDEIGKRSGFVNAGEETYLNIARSRAALEADVARILKAENLTESSYNLLRILRGHKRRADDGDAEERNGGARNCGELLAEMVVRAADVTRLVNRMEKNGLVKRNEDPSDGRGVLIRITPKGLRTAERLDEPLANIHAKQFNHLTPDELDTLNRLLEKLRDR